MSNQHNLGVVPITRALISVYDKTGIEDFAWFLTNMNIEILSTGGTANALKKARISVTDISAYTGFPECFDGRLKTLHPRVHGGLLFRREDARDLKDAADLGIKRIDLVVVNLYPFVQVLKRADASDEMMIEHIDIGGPTMLRSGAKNHESVAVASKIEHYKIIQDQMQMYNSCTTWELRRFLAGEVFTQTAEYDTAIANYFLPKKTAVS